MGVIIEDVRYLDKFRPSETDVDWSLYNIGEPYDVEIDYRVEEVVINDAENYADGVNTIVTEPLPYQSGIADATNLIWCNNNQAFENIHVGDTIVLTGSKAPSEDGTYTVSEKIDNGAFRVSGGTLTSRFLAKGGTIHVTTPFAGHKYLFNWIENEAPTQFIEVESQQENQLYYDSATTALGATSMLWNGNGTNEIEGATIEGGGASTYGQKFTIKHTGVVTPFFLAAQLADTQARLNPDYFEAGNCLKHVFKLEVNRDLSNPNDLQTIIYDEREGNTGWLNENYNGQKENYTFSNLVLTRVSDATTLDALELSSTTDATFTVTNTVDSPFSATLTKGMGVFWILPDLETSYQNNSRTLKENFVYDYGLNTIATITNGNNFGTTLQAIEEVEITYVDADNIDVRIRFSFGSLAQSIINENDFKNYLFGFTIENESLTRETSDKTTLFVNTNQFYVQLFDSNLITNTTGFLFHRYSDFSDAVSLPDVYPVDDLIASSQFNIDFNGLESDGIDILSVSHELVLKHATNAEILVESNTYNTAGSDLLNGYVPLIEVNQNRAFTIADNDFRKLVSIERDSVNDSGTIFAYKTTYPFFVRWETWEALSVSNPPSGVYDSSLPNNGLNNFLYRYSVEGYTLNYRLRFTILQNGEQFTQEFDSPTTMYDFDSNTAWENEYIKPYDVATNTELTSGGDKFLQGYVDTRLEAQFDKVLGVLPSISDVDIVFWLIGKEKGTIKSVKRASSFYADSGDTSFKGITTPNLVDKSSASNLYDGKVLTDFTKLSGNEFTVYSRIYDNTPPPYPFVFTVDTTISGSSGVGDFQLPFVSGATYNSLVDWGDGNTDTITAWNQTETLHSYSVAGIYTIKIYAQFDLFRFSNAGDKLKMVSIDQWGDNLFTSFSASFYGCTNMVGKFFDTPNLSSLTDMSSMFRDCSSFNSSISGWDMSTVTNTSIMFRGCTLFNQSLSTWDMSNVTTLVSMFRDCIAFDGSIDAWDTSSVNNMSTLFYGATTFNQPLNSWNTSSVTNMSLIFYNCNAFNQPLSSWNTSIVTDISNAFFGCAAFNQSIDSWNVSSVTTLLSTFSGCTAFNQPLNSWVTTALTNTDSTFLNCTAFNQSLSSWNMTNVTDTSNMFYNCAAFNGSIDAWDVSSVIDMNNMFFGCTVFNSALNSWTTTSVTDMGGLFLNCTAFNKTLSNWDTSIVTTMASMFNGCSAFDQNVGAWDISSVTTMEFMFNSATLSTSNYDNTLTGWTGWSGGVPTKTVLANVTFSGGSSTYTTGSTADDARTYLTGTKTWTISDGGGV